MPQIRVTEIVPFSQSQMYHLVVDVERYPDFLPWCIKSRVLERGENQFLAELTVAFKGIRESFQTLDILTPEHKVEVNLRSGPFRYLASTWTFTPLSAQRTRIDFFIDFTFQSRMKEMLLGPVFTQISKQMVTAFCTRAVATFNQRCDTPSNQT
ncbi:type II toxin-antitoxin system RatA family toxin [Candidatus Magnetaquicoccus inordinatus]|uniref:type II toxin-antitoxin system RatA family toxin n=1 Tax=Candidatus Magnetaquicoccus inordinatus TaxID=2496818 RepID=UPI00102C4B93|nr:type II toxin-antitoxin system RatA family toxin [Candidatus Magnetaquicoccus inordinatus]